MRCQKTETKSIESEMTFYRVTNSKLYNVLENTEIEIKRLLNSNDIQLVQGNPA